MKWLDNFIVSERGQWDYPGYPTAVRTKNGRITMEGVPYPVMGFVPGQPPIMMQPGGKYQFPGNMVYEIPMVKAQVGLNVPSWLNPYNWGVEDYTDKGNFSNAYEAAKKAGEEEFMYNDKRYNTKYAGTPRQEVGSYGVNGKAVSRKELAFPYQVTEYSPLISKYLPGHIEAQSPDRVAVNYSKTGNNLTGLNTVGEKGKKTYNVYGNVDELKFSDKAFSLPTGKYFLEDTYRPSDWNLFTNNCADNVCDAFGIPRSKGIQTPGDAMQKIQEKYATLDVTGRTREDYNKLYTELQKKSPKDILSQANNILGIASSPDIQYTSLGRRLVSTVQATLDKEGYPLPKSTRKDWETRQTGKFDGVIGPETLNALKEWQSKNTKKNFGGDISIPDLSRPNWLSKYQEGGITQKIYNDPEEFAAANRNYNHRLDIYNQANYNWEQAKNYATSIDKDGIVWISEDLLGKVPKKNIKTDLNPITKRYTFSTDSGHATEFPLYEKPIEEPVYVAETRKDLYMPPSNTAEVLSQIKQEDLRKQEPKNVPAPDFRHGGWLDEYQGNILSSEVRNKLIRAGKEHDNFNEALDWQNQWHNSPMYNQMVINSFKNDQSKADYLTKLRKENLQNLPDLSIKYEGNETPYGFNAAGTSDSNTGEVTVYPNEQLEYDPSLYIHELSHSSDRPRGKYSFDYPGYKTNKPWRYFAENDPDKIINGNHRLDENKNVVLPPKWMFTKDSRFPGEVIYNDRVMPQSDTAYIHKNRGSNWKDNQSYIDSERSLKPITDEEIALSLSGFKYPPDHPEYQRMAKDIKDEWTNIITRDTADAKEKWKKFSHPYIAQPTEVRARLNEIRYNAQKQNLYDPFTEKPTPEIFKKLEGHALDNLRTDFTDEEILWMLQNISYNDKPNTETVPSGRYGGSAKWLDQFQGDEGSSQVPSKLSWIGNKGQVLTEQQQEEKLLDKKFGIGPTVDKAEAIKAKERLKKTKRIETLLPSGAITPVMGPVEYALMAPVAASTVSAAAPIIGSGLNASIAGIPGLTAGNALGAGFATDAIVNRLPQVPGQISRGEYADAAVNVLTGGLDLFGAGMVSPLFKGVKAAKKLPGSPNSGNVVDELREELQREGIVQSQKTLNLPWKNIIRKGVNPWTYDIPNKVDDIKSLIFSKIKNPAYTEPDEIERQYQMYKKFLVKPGEKVLSKDDYISQLDPDMFFRTRKEVVNNRFNTRFSENQTRGIKNRYTTWDMYLGKPQIENPMYDISHLTKSKDDVIYTIKEDFMDKPAIENRLAHVIGDIETGTAGTHRPVAKKTGDNKWIHLDNDSYFGGMGGFHWDIKKLPNGNYEAYANDVWDLQPFKGRDLPKSIRNIEAGKALGIGKPLNVKVGFEIDKDTKKILKTYGMAPGAVAGAAALKKEKNGGWLDNNQDYNYIKYKDLSLSRGTGWLDNYK